MLKRSKKRKIILTVIFSVVFICVLWNAYEYLALKKEVAYYSNKSDIVGLYEPVDLVGLLDSYGVPYSPSVDKSFFGYLEEDLEEAGLLSSSLDLYGLYINKTWELNGIFRNDVTIGEMKTMQNFGMDFVRHKYGKERIREDLVYTCDESLEDVTVASYYSELERPMVLYSCAANDLFYYFNTSLESLNIAKLLKIAMNFGNSLSLLECEVKSNIETLMSYNPNTVIIVMGLYVPSDNFFLQRLGSLIVNRVNSTLENVCAGCSNAAYIDVSCLSFTVLEGDFHLNREGHWVLKSILEDLIDSRPLNIDNQPKVSREFASDKKERIDKEKSVSVDNLVSCIEKIDIPKEDYVEWAVATEEVLFEKGLSDISYDDLIALQEDFTVRNIEMERKGIAVLVIERKIQNNSNVGDFTLERNVLNDKLSLMPYLAD